MVVSATSAAVLDRRPGAVPNWQLRSTRKGHYVASSRARANPIRINMEMDERFLNSLLYPSADTISRLLRKYSHSYGLGLRLNEDSALIKGDILYYLCYSCLELCMYKLLGYTVRTILEPILVLS